jgi:hypothetical protein
MDPRSGDFRSTDTSIANQPGLTSDTCVEGLETNISTGSTAPGDRHGLLCFSRPIKVLEVRDGLSNTVMMGERPPSHDGFWGWWGFSPVDTHLGVAATLRLYTTGKNGTCPLGEARFGPGEYDDVCDYHHFWSFHTDGGMWLFGDGSVRFLPYSASDILLGLSTRSGGEVVPSDF